TLGHVDKKSDPELCGGEIEETHEGQGDLTDQEWAMIGPLLPPERGRWARPAGDNRLFLNGMLHVLRTGCP
ncbi:transposase, partial [Gluconobacter japonicus]|uniref:transposase n=1 Tax=Gluconobacter japonicus TaxID=376620 RepID=UPI000AE4E282